MPDFFTFFSFYLFLSLTALAQKAGGIKETYIFKGRLTDADSGIAVTHAHVANPYKGKITVSNAEGSFTMPVEGGDTLLVTRIGYTTLKYAVPASDPNKIVLIEVAPKTEELQEVVITKFPSESRFKEQLLGLNLPEEKQPALNVPHPSLTREYDPDAPMIAAGGVISGIANKFNDKERGRQFKARMELKEQREAYIATKFNKDIVQQITGLKDEEKLNEFMKFCVLSEDFLYKANEYEIHDAVLGCFKDFIASK